MSDLAQAAEVSKRYTTHVDSEPLLGAVHQCLSIPSPASRHDDRNTFTIHAQPYQNEPDPPKKVHTQHTNHSSKPSPQTTITPTLLPISQPRLRPLKPIPNLAKPIRRRNIKPHKRLPPDILNPVLHIPRDPHHAPLAHAMRHARNRDPRRAADDVVQLGVRVAVRG